tara:strand:+ start:211 stop:834 length:624 start_codon:yes stop_codon:yes gene_type:complete
MNYTLLLLVFLLAILLWGSREGFVDFGLSGWSKPVDHYSFVEKDMNIDMNTYKKDLTDITTTKLRNIISSIQVYAKAKTQQCLEPIETIYVNKYSGPQGSMYDTRMMFYDQKNYFMTEIMTKLLEKPGGDGTFQVASMRTQIPAGDASGPAGSDMSASQPMSQFLPQIDILDSISPSKTGMEAVLKSISKDAGAPPPPGQPPTGFQS